MVKYAEYGDEVGFDIFIEIKGLGRTFRKGLGRQKKKGGERTNLRPSLYKASEGRGIFLGWCGMAGEKS